MFEYSGYIWHVIPRMDYLSLLADAVRRSPIVALLGPRQCGKTTLARLFGEGRQATFFDLESEPHRLSLQNPELALGAAEGVVVLDEIQTMPALFPALRVLADRPRTKARFLLLGSASPALVKKASESLAGRVEFVEMGGFDVEETGADSWRELWARGGFPRAYLAGSDQDSAAWREGFVKTFLERDIPSLGITIPPAALRRFWTMLAHYHGQTWNASELARAMGIADKTVRSYLDILTGAYMVRQLQPWHENLSKRQVKAPKIYLRDSGLLHSLLGVPEAAGLLGHPKVGASFEGFIVEQVARLLHPPELYFWGAHTGAELDLLLMRGGRRFGVEIKFSEAPKITRSMRTAIEDLKLDRLIVVAPGERSYPIDEKIEVLAARELARLRGIVAEPVSARASVMLS